MPTYTLNQVNYEYTVGVETASVAGAVSIYLITGNINLLSSFVVNSFTYNVRSIKNFAFASSANITSITIPNSITSIGNNTFYQCIGATSITVPNTITSIGNSAFEQCTELTSINIPNTVTSIGSQAFYQCFKITSINIPTLLTTINNSTFKSCMALTSITIPNSVTSIGSEAFYHCTSLTSITIPNLVTSISNGTFGNCMALTSITIPNSVTSIGNNAFQNCNNLTSITIPSLVTSIGSEAFFNCIRLSTVTFMGFIPTISTNNFTVTGDTALYKSNINTDQTLALSKLTMFTNKNTFVSQEPNPTLTNFSIPTKTIGDAAFTITAPTSNSTGAFVYISSNTAVATVAGSTITIVGAGSSTITAVQANTVTYTSGAIAATLTVNPITTVLSNFSVPTKTFGDPTFAITSPTSNSVGLITYTSSNTAVATVAGNVITIVGGGSSTITASQASSGNYSSGTITSTLTVNPSEPALTNFSVPTKTFGDPTFAITSPTSNSAGAFTYTTSNIAVATVSGDVITIIGGGSSTISATQASTTNYTSGITTANLTINPAAPVLSNFSVPAKTFGDTTFTITPPTSNSDGNFTYTSSTHTVTTVSGDVITIIGGGSSTISAIQASTSNYTSGITTSTIIVNPAAPTISNFSVLTKTFGDTPFTITPPTSNSAGAFTYTSSNTAVATIAGNVITIIGGGSSTISAIQASTTNYTSGTITTTFTVNKAIPALTNFSVPSKKIGTRSFKLSNPTSNSNGTITYVSSNRSVARVKGNVTTIVGGGISTITAFQESTPNYESATLTGFFNNGLMTAILNNGTTWVAAGSALKYSTTGKIWTTASGPTNVNSLAWTGTQWLAGCDGSNNLYTSIDAITWNLNTSLHDYTVTKVAYANNTFFVLSIGTIFFSQNFGSWSSRVESVGAITGFSYTGTHYLFSSGTTLIKSQDLTTWTTSSLPSASTYLTINNSSEGSATVKPMTLACSDSVYNTLGYTYDGIQWYGTGKTVLQIRANHAAWNGTIWITVGKSVGTWFAISRDGINWQQQSDLLFDEAYAVAWNGSYWIVAGEGATYSLAKSTDGVLWTGIVGSKTIFSTRAVDIAWNDFQWTAYGSPTAIATSTDGTTWDLLPTVVGDASSVLLSSPTMSVTSSTGANPEYAFDLSPSTTWTSGTGLYNSGTGLYSGSDPAGGEWLQIDLTTPYAVKHYSIASINGLQWSFDGSSDGSTWTPLDTQEMEFTTSTSNQLFLSTANTSAYRYYRFVFQMVVAGSTSVQVKDIDLFTVDANRELSKYYRISNTKKWMSSVVNTGYSSLMQYDGIPSAYLNTRFLNTSTPISLQTSYSYDGQYNLITDLSNASVYYATDFSNNVFTPVSLPTMDKKYASCFNGTHFFVGGSGTNLIMYAHPSNMTTWFPTANADTIFSGGKIISLVSNSGLGFVSPPNSIYLTPGEKLSLVAPKFYDENMERRGATFNFTLKGT
jgi:hypothetical protein